MNTDDTEQLISVDPDPPAAGQGANFGYSGNVPVTITIKWGPASAGIPDTTIEITSTSNPVKVAVPSGATSFIAHDESGASADLAGAVT